MGLDTSHDCWHGAYSSFNDWRHRIAEAASIPLDEMVGYGGTRTWLQEDVITQLLSHSDCDGYIEARVCIPLADRLEALIPLLPEKVYSAPIEWKIEGPRPTGRRDQDSYRRLIDAVKRDQDSYRRLIDAVDRMFPEGYYRTKTRQFVAGLRLAASLNENVEFR